MDDPHYSKFESWCSPFWRILVVGELEINVSLSLGTHVSLKDRATGCESLRGRSMSFWQLRMRVFIKVYKHGQHFVSSGNDITHFDGSPDILMGPWTPNPLCISRWDLVCDLIRHINGRDVGWSRVEKVESVGLHYTAPSRQFLDAAVE